jgi:hypothetical protein
MTLSFQLRHDPDLWLLDDVSIRQGPTEMIGNGGFETNSFPPWTRSMTGACAPLSFPVVIGSSQPRTGLYSIEDGCAGASDRLSQTFAATAGQIYVISYWLRSTKGGAGISANITLT